MSETSHHLIVSINHSRQLTALVDQNLAIIIIAIVGVVLFLAGIFCYCKQRSTTNVQFEVFHNEHNSAKDVKADPSGTTNQIDHQHKNDLSKDNQDINTTTESKKKRRRKKDRLQAHSNRDISRQQPEDTNSQKLQKQESNFDIE